VISPELYDAGRSAVIELQGGTGLWQVHDVIQSWGSVWVGLAVIVNRLTPLHRDWGGAPPIYDFLVSAGTHDTCTLDVPDIGAKFKYSPGTVVPICGKALRHGVAGWSGGERICLAYFMKDAVLDRLHQPRPSWPNHSTYMSLIDD